GADQHDPYRRRDRGCQRRRDPVVYGGFRRAAAQRRQGAPFRRARGRRPERRRSRSRVEVLTVRRALLLAAVAISAAPAACAFILDFDELQEGSALPSSDASVGDATGDSDCVCTSNDPCRPQECVEGQCVEKPYVGLAYDGYHATFSADQVPRITLAQQRAGAFYC